MRILRVLALLAGLSLSACSTAQGASPAAPSAVTSSPTEIRPSSTPSSRPAFTPTQTPAATATLAPGASREMDKDGMIQVFVPAGDFTMGSDDKDAKKSLANGRAYTEIPVHTVRLDSYWIDKFEVTNGQYAMCVNAGVCQPPHLFTIGEPRDPATYHPFYYNNSDYADYPVVWVSWFMAGTYCGWAGRRLPTEAEWEKAGRGTDARTYPWGNDPVDSDKANLCDINCPLPHANGKYNDGFPVTAPVGSFPHGASPYGVMDMAGNVWEWTSSIIRDYPYSAVDGREDLTVSDVERSWRGGSWTNGYWWMRASLRYRSVDWYWNYNLGFRCAASD